MPNSAPSAPEADKSNDSKKTAVAIGVCVLVVIGLVMSMQSVSLITGSGPVWTGVAVVAAGTAVFGIGRGASRGRGRAGRAVSPGRRAAATAERAAVLIAGPLGLCFLPAFVCLGIVPVVAALAGDLLQSGLL
jgi:hypothetical protein